MTTATAVRRYFWLMTVETENGQSTLKNTCDIAAGTTRSQAYESIRQHVAEQIGSSRFTTVFFTLDSEEL